VARRWSTAGAHETKLRKKDKIMEGSIQVALAALGAALAVGFIGAKASEGVARNPGAATPVLVQSILAMALAEGVLFITIFMGK
jgi:F-type H+-transporting ATPase subunit c